MGQDLELFLHLTQEELQEKPQEELQELQEELQELQEELQEAKQLLQVEALLLPRVWHHAGRCRHGLSSGTAGSTKRKSAGCHGWDTATRV